jgi:hypothetical protein
MHDDTDRENVTLRLLSCTQANPGNNFIDNRRNFSSRSLNAECRIQVCGPAPLVQSGEILAVAQQWSINSWLLATLKQFFCGRIEKHRRNLIFAQKLLVCIVDECSPT